MVIENIFLCSLGIANRCSLGIARRTSLFYKIEKLIFYNYLFTTKKKKIIMTSFNELAITFKNILDDLFNSNGFECRKLFYGDEIFYCGKDILKCLGYGQDRKDVYKALSKLEECVKFTINELEEKYSPSTLKVDNEINK